MYIHATLIVAGIVNMLLMVGVESAAEYSDDNGSDGNHDGDGSVEPQAPLSLHPVQPTTTQSPTVQTHAGQPYPAQPYSAQSYPVQPYPAQSPLAQPAPLQPAVTGQIRDVTAATLRTRTSECAWAVWKSYHHSLGSTAIQGLRAFGPEGEDEVDLTFKELSQVLNNFWFPVWKLWPEVFDALREGFSDGVLFDFAESTNEVTAIIIDCFNLFDRVDQVMRLDSAQFNDMPTPSPSSPVSVSYVPPVDSWQLTLPPIGALFRFETMATLMTRCAECRWAVWQLYRTISGGRSPHERPARQLWLRNIAITIKYLFNVVQPTWQPKNTTFTALCNLFRNGLLFDFNNPNDELAAIARDCANLFERLDQMARQNVPTTPSPAPLLQLSPVE